MSDFFTFNSRPHKEVDRRIDEVIPFILFLSTHDLTRRSTQRHTVFDAVKIPFNSRPHKEVDNSTNSSITFSLSFQLTTSQGGRRCCLLCPQEGNCLSTHDLTRRSTVFNWFIWERDGLSTHDLTRRSTFVPCSPDTGHMHFQLTTSQGGRLPHAKHFFSF